jgi:hypothetical protein
MSISWSKATESGCLYLRGRTDSAYQVAVCALAPTAGMSHYLMPVRIAENEAGGDDPFARSINSHTNGLQAKIRAIDRLHLSEVKFGASFGAARMIVLTPQDGREDDAWYFAKQAISDLKNYLPLPVVSQIDYDQKRLHKSLGSTLDSIDFAVRHDPSAIATTHAFLALLAEKGLMPEEMALSVTGVGDLGSRLVRKFLEYGVGEVVIADRDVNRLHHLAVLPRVRVANIDELPHDRCHAHVLSADKSFTDEVGKAWAQNEFVQAVGGPEAGLDRFIESRRLLAQRGKEFVPSVLCGCLGLVSNLEESLGIQPDLELMSRKYDRMMAILIGRMKGHGKGLAQVCEEVLDGAETFNSSECDYIRSAS